MSLAPPGPGPTDSRPLTLRRPPTAIWRLGADIRALPQYTDLLRTLTEHRIRVRYKQSVLGLGWAILQPLAMMVIFTLVFGRIARMPTAGVPYPLFAFTGLVLWSFVSTSLSNTTHALVAHASLITKVYFPREILPLSYIAAALFDFGIGVIVLMAMLRWYGEPVGVHLLFAVPVVAITAILVTSIALAVSALQVRFRDIGLAVPMVLYLWMFTTPVAYPLSSVPARYKVLFEINPLTGLVESFRQIVLEQHAASPTLLAVPLLTAAVLLPLSYALFKRTEATMADII
jgi:lipopolysaccharide transport system permease protein